MLNIFRWIALVSAVVFALALAGALLSSERANAPTEKQPGQNYQTEQSNQKENVSLWDSVFPDAISLYTLFLTLFAGLAVLVAIYQWKSFVRAERTANVTAEAAKTAADTAKNALIASQRAWMATPAPRLDGEIKAGNPIIIELLVQNVGRDPAIGVNHHGVAMMFDMPDQISYAPEIWSDQFREVLRLESDLAPPMKGLASIFPSSQLSLPVRWTDLKSLPDFIAGKKLLVIYGAIGYLTMGQPHHTWYCLYLARDETLPGKYRFANCPIGNDAN